MNRKFSRKIFIALLSFAIGATGLRAETGPAASKQALFFSNGDFLFGNLDSIGRDKSVVWRRDDALAPIEFSGTNITEIKFASGKKSNPAGTNLCRLHLRNGDFLEGDLLQLNREEIVLETSFAGKMAFPRKRAHALESLPPEREPIFVGPSGLEGWTMGKVTAVAAGEAGEWKYANGAFYATHSASIARDMKLPDMARIEFDLAWKGMLQTAIALYTKNLQPVNLASKDTEPDFGGFYSLQINSFMATLMPVKKNEPLKYLGQIPVPTLSQKTRAHFEVLVNKKRANIVLLADGILVKEWIDADGFAGSGTAMRFVQQGGQGSLKLSNLRIAEWNGKRDEKSTNAPSTKDDLARLLNGDKVSGTLESFRDGKITISTGGSKLDVPLNRVSEIQFAGEKSEEPPGIGLNVRAFFAGGGRITFRVDHWDKSVVGESPNFGRATFLPAAFERVQINPVSTNDLTLKK